MSKKTAQRTERSVVAKLAPPVPFNEALRRLVNAPPQHKTAKKLAKKKPGQ